MAAATGNRGAICMMLKARPNLDRNPRDCYGRTLLMYAAFAWHARAVAYLFDAGTNLEARDNGGRSALSLAVDGQSRPERWEAGYFSSHTVAASQEERKETVRALLDLSADPYSRSNDGNIPCHYAMEGPAVNETVQLMLVAAMEDEWASFEVPCVSMYRDSKEI